MYRAIGIGVEVRWSLSLLSSWVRLLGLGSHNRICEGGLFVARPIFMCVESRAIAVDNVVYRLVLTDLLLGGAIVHLPALDSLAGISNQDATRTSSFLGYRNIYNGGS